jgi:hypothetical protein
MTKAELRDKLKAEGVWESSRSTPTWKLAFDLYQKEMKARLCNCGSSYTRLRNWMNS